MDKQKLPVGKGVLIGGFIVVLALVGVIFLVPKNSPVATPIPTPAPVAEELPATPEPSPKVYLLEEVQAHADAASCWTVVRGNVYDVTAFIDKHKGGSDKILGLCGINGTSAFETKHGGQELQETMLETLKIGVLN
jgi:hypothetical protein